MISCFDRHFNEIDTKIYVSLWNKTIFPLTVFAGWDGWPRRTSNASDFSALSPPSCKWWEVAEALLVCLYLSRWDRLQGTEKIHYLTHFSQFPNVFKANNHVSIWRSSTTLSKPHAPIPPYIHLGGVAGKNRSHPKIKPSRFLEAVWYKVTTTQPLSASNKENSREYILQLQDYA